MRLKPDRTSKAKGWHITTAELAGWLVAYGLPIPDELEKTHVDTLPINGINGSDGITAQPEEQEAAPAMETFEL